ncbi:MAG: DUF1648 domain-containing protein [Blastocatellia bacterium]|nr:DUF1648 domain-containing protein [Blastocatellia bacterium]
MKRPASPNLWILRLVPFVLLGSAALWLHFNWEQIPPRWAIHWGAHGQPDGFSTKTPLGVYFILIFGSGLAVFVQLIGLIVGKVTQNSGNLPEVAATEFGRVTMEFTVWLSLAMAFIFSLLGVWLPLFPPQNSISVVLTCFGAVLLCVGYGIFRFKQTADWLRTLNLPGLEQWNGGLFYSNPADERLWVPKITGAGYTINFSHKRAWPVFLLMTGLPLLIALVVVTLALTAQSR